MKLDQTSGTAFHHRWSIACFSCLWNMNVCFRYMQRCADVFTNYVRWRTAIVRSQRVKEWLFRLFLNWGEFYCHWLLLLSFSFTALWMKQAQTVGWLIFLSFFSITPAKEVMPSFTSLCWSVGFPAGLHKKLLNGFPWHMDKGWVLAQNRPH